MLILKRKIAEVGFEPTTYGFLTEVMSPSGTPDWTARY